MKDEIELGHVGRILRRRWGSILIGLGSVLASVIVLTHFSPRTYVAESSILVEKRSRGGDAPALEVLERLGRGSSIETEIELLQSRRVLEPVVDSLDLHVMANVGSGDQLARDVFRGFDATPDAVPGAYQLVQDSAGAWLVLDASTRAPLGGAPRGGKVTAAGLTFMAPSDQSSGGLITVVSVSRAAVAVQRRIGARLLHREADLILLTCEGPSPAEAHNLCRATSRSYVNLRSSLQRSEATSTAAFLRTQVGRIGKQLRVSEDSLQSFRRKSGAVALPEQASAQVRDAANLAAQREQIEAERSALADRIGKVDAKEGSDQRYQELASFPTLFKNAAITSLLQSLVELQNKRADLALRRQDKNPDLAAVDARIAEIQRQLHTTATGYETALAAQVRSLDQALASRGIQMAGLPARQVESARRERQVGLLADLHHSLELRLREAEVGEAVDLPSVEIADSASMPIGPASPNVKTNLALGLILGLGFGLGIAVVRENRDTRIYEWQQLAEQTSVPVLSLIPRVGRGGPLLDIKSGGESRSQLGRSESDPQVLIPSRRGRSRGQRAAAEIKNRGETGLALEAFRSLGAELGSLARDLESGVLSSVAITSAGPGEGKTFTACNLALARAASGSRTLLMDCDFRASGVSAFFDLPRRGAGLTDVLRGSVSFAEASSELHLDGQSKLTVLTAGSAPADAGRLLESKQFIAFVRDLANQFDLIVVDTPPLNILTDGSAVARAVDGVLVVVRKGVTDQRELEMMLERLRRIGHPPIGLVFGQVTIPKPYLSYMEPAV